MKKILYLVSVVTTLLFVACENDSITKLDQSVVEGNAKIVLQQPDVDSTIVITKENLAEEMLEFTADQPDFGAVLAPVYSIEVSMTEDFKVAQALSTTASAYKIPVTNEVVNAALNALFQLGAFPSFSEELKVYFRMKADFSAAVNNPVDKESMIRPSYSNVITLMLKGSEIIAMPNLYYLVGGFASWGTALGLDLIPLTPVNDYKYILNDGKGEFVFKTFIPAETEFKVKGDIVGWVPQWGSADGNSIASTTLKTDPAATDPSNFKVAEEGFYQFSLNTVENTLSIEPLVDYEVPSIAGTPVTSIQMVGTLNEWGDKPESEHIMIQHPKLKYVYYADVTLATDGELKFRANEKWELSWGGKSFPYKTSGSNENIPVKAGKYRVVFNMLDGAYYFFEQK